MKNPQIFLFIFLGFFIPTAQSQRHMITPEFLQKGDTVAIIATARKIDATTLQPAIKLLESWGLNVVLGKTIGKEDHQLAGPDWQRATDLQEMMDNPKIKAIWAAKGGYGTVRIVDRIDFTAFKKKPKWICGFSDVTVLHSHLNNMGIETLHSLMAVSAKTASPEAIESFRKALFGEKLEYKMPAHAYNKTGKAKGELVGGNLSVLYSVMGSKSEIDYKGKILFLEDLDEYLYHIDRMLMNLKRNGYFDGLKAVVIGGMTQMNDNEIPWGKDALQIVQDVLKDYKFPIIYNFPAGHIKDNRAMILGKTVSIEVGATGSTVKFE
ncbi:S66 peptidase family protein [Flavobacterium caeni]|uniref:Muramoyltetrapeptide carboxypeptidase n=1 Tax=Flavobacterium caeni TaxID=490189 RepID=A0A1G5E140_9FLAO|nr:LD-carboxypeptidase [Flavobacterium caeni]SCY20470.1 muramoyltetrapeptide carboxypeptidase [Flavobacterium caeni]